MSVHDIQHYPEIKRLLGIPEDEPIFILRAQDEVSLDTVEAYIDMSEKPGNDPTFMQNLRQVADEFNHWQVEHSDKVKQAD